jgi:hypothetical protein
MAVTITPLAGARYLQVEGDVQAILEVPAHPPEWVKQSEMVDSYYLSFSDGTLIQASHADDPEFHVVIEGAGRVVVSPSGRELFLDWGIEWINLGPRRGATAFARKGPMNLPLLELLEAAP